ncbi:MAG TPA: sensor histidine kinase [Ramlibacter sp.]|jgi:signal transduction histidine kinase|nr:sensor histidine kinase [Ramlibacter sp.]
MQIPQIVDAWSSAKRHLASVVPSRAFAFSVTGPAVKKPTPSRLSDFIRNNSEEILLAWDEFAATVQHGGAPLDAVTLRDHAAEILSTIATDLAQPQSSAQQDAKGKGQAPRDWAPTPAETHADFRMVAGFAVDAMITEYRALRASVLKIWAKQGGGNTSDDLADLTRFNEAIDQSIAESVARYTRQTRSSTELFIGILGHDIRNPLGTIMMSSEALVRSGKITREAITPITNAAGRIRSIIEQVVDFTRAQTDGVMPIVRTPSNLATALSRVVQETQVRHPSRTLRLETTGNFDGSWDEGRIGQLVSNLLGNALLYGAADTDVTVKMGTTEDRVWFSVHNLGPAIAAEDRDRIFQPLERGIQNQYGSDRREPTGLGLGLYICREIVHAHEGRLSLASSDADGTTFMVELPRAAGLAPLPA